MFSGIVEQLGELKRIARKGDVHRLRIRLAHQIEGLQVGESISVDGVCLTVTALGDHAFEVDVGPETLARTTLGRREGGDRVNLERPLTLATHLGGHLVQGHVDGAGRIRAVTRQDETAWMEVEAPPTLMRYIVEKGSIAVDGVSLTVAAVGDNWFGVSLIPYTLAITTLGQRRADDLVNLEVDVLAKYAERLLGSGPSTSSGRPLDSARDGERRVEPRAESSRKESQEMPGQAFVTVDRAVEAIRAGRMVVVVDDEDRENEGDLVMAAVHVTPDAINFMTREGRGLLCVPITEARARELDLRPMVEKNTSKFQTAFTVSVTARQGVTTGISAYDRAATIRALADSRARPEDLARPGHIFPLIAREGGVLERPGHTEAAVELARLAGLPPVGVICEILSSDGSMARSPELALFSSAHGISMVRIRDLVEFRLGQESPLRRVAETQLPTDEALWKVVAYEHRMTGDAHLALVLGSLGGDPPVLVRLHSECLSGDVFGSHRCDCGYQLEESMKRIAAERRGVIVYLRQEGRGVGLLNKVKAYALQDAGSDTVEANLQLKLPADARDHGVGAQILADLGVTRVRLLTNNPAKIAAVEAEGIEVTERVPLSPPLTPQNLRYLLAKRDKLQHLLDFDVESFMVKERKLGTNL